MRSFATDNDIRPVSDVEEAHLNQVLGRITKYAPYDTHETKIVCARISRLITPQIAINDARAIARAPVVAGMTDAELLKLMTEAAGTPEAITRQALGMGPSGGALLFTSFDEDIRLHHPPQFRTLPVSSSDSESPSFENICFPIGGGIPFAAAYRVDITPGVTRLILGNGIHRAYRLAAAGYEWCPLALTHVTPMEVPEQLVDLPKDFLLSPEANPPLIADFLDKSAAIQLDYYRVLKTIRINWNFEQYATVLKQ